MSAFYLNANSSRVIFTFSSNQEFLDKFIHRPKHSKWALNHTEGHSSESNLIRWCHFFGIFNIVFLEPTSTLQTDGTKGDKGGQGSPGPTNYGESNNLFIFNNPTIKVCLSFLDWVSWPPRLGPGTWQCPRFYIVAEAMHKVSGGPLKGAV